MATSPPPSRRLPAWLNSSAARLLLLTAGMAAIVLAAIVIPTLFSDDSEEPVETTSAWARAFIYDGATGQGVSINPDGSVVEAYNGMGRFVESRVVARSRSIAFLSEDAIDVGPVPADLSGPGIFNVPVPEGADVAVLGVPDRLVLAVHSEAGGNLVLVDVDNRQVLDIAKLLNVAAPTLTLNDLQLEPSGQVFAIYDPELKRTAILSFSKPSPTFIAARGLGISTDRVVAVVDDQLAVFELDGTPLASYSAGKIVSATMDGTIAYLITDGDDILRLDDGAKEPKLLARVPDAKQVVIADGGDRLVIDSPWGFSFLSSNGDELGQLSPDADGVETPARHSRCIGAGINELFTPGSSQQEGPTGPNLIALDDLDVAALPALALQTSSPEGCTVAVAAVSDEYFTLHSLVGALSTGAGNTATPTVGPYKRMFMSPDPNQWIAMTSDGRIELIELVDGTAQVVTEIPFPSVDYITVAFVTP